MTMIGFQLDGRFWLATETLYKSSWNPFYDSFLIVQFLKNQFHHFITIEFCSIGMLTSIEISFAIDFNKILIQYWIIGHNKFFFSVNDWKSQIKSGNTFYSNQVSKVFRGSFWNFETLPRMLELLKSRIRSSGSP